MVCHHTCLWQAYLDAYCGSALNEWKERVREHDMSAARYLWLYILTNFYPNVCHAHAHLIVILCSSLINRVHLIASVPGAHTGANMDKWGHMKLRKVYIWEREREREREERVSPHSLVQTWYIEGRPIGNSVACMKTDDMQHYEGTVGHYLPWVWSCMWLDFWTFILCVCILQTIEDWKKQELSLIFSQYKLYNMWLVTKFHGLNLIKYRGNLVHRKLSSWSNTHHL